MNKYDKIRALRDMNLNTENSFLAVNNNYELPKYAYFSLRTQWTNPAKQQKTPHCPWIKRSRVRKTVKELLKNGLEVIIAQGINPDNALFAGCVMKKRSVYVVEIAQGLGTVRRVTHDHQIDERHIVNAFLPRTNNKRVNQVLNTVHSLPELYNAKHDFLLEFSYYNQRVGWKQEPIIFWEYYKT